MVSVLLAGAAVAIRPFGPFPLIPPPSPLILLLILLPACPDLSSSSSSESSISTAWFLAFPVPVPLVDRAEEEEATRFVPAIGRPLLVVVETAVEVTLGSRSMAVAAEEELEMEVPLPVKSLEMKLVDPVLLLLLSLSGLEGAEGTGLEAVEFLTELFIPGGTVMAYL